MRTSESKGALATFYSGAALNLKFLSRTRRDTVGTSNSPH
jgi:hypothetical protein